MSEESALAIAKNYPADKFNLLIPVKTMQELSPLHKLVINEVQISPNPADRDVYQEKNKEYALTKKGLSKLMKAANIQHINTKSVPTQKCTRCIEIARVTKQAPKCFECPYQDDIKYEVTIAVPQLSGTYQIYQATKELRMADEQAKMTDAQFKQFKPFRTEQCESKALNRALREGLSLKSSYTAAELKKPFVVCLVMPNMDDPDLKRAMIDRYANNASALYGDVAPVSGQNALPTGEVTIIDADDDIDFDTGEITPPDGEVIDITEEEPLTCEDCGKELEPVEDKNGKEWTVEDLVDLSMGHFNRVLCPACYNKASKAKKKAGEK